MTLKNQQHFFLRCVLTLALLTGTASVQALALLTSTTSVQTLVLLVGMTAAQADESGDLDFDSLGLSLAELFNLEVTIATGIKQSVAKAPAVTSVITAKDIEAMGATNVDEVLETVPGLHVARANAGMPLYTIRGIYSGFNYEILVLINGIVLKEPWVGDRSSAWGGMPVNAIQRIEIIRGPGSAMYGADAFSGVINIITKTKKDIDGTEVGMRMGSFDTTDAWLLHGAEWEGFDVALTLEYHNTDGHREIVDVDAQTEFDRLDGTNASLAPCPVNFSRRNLDTRLDIEKGNWKLRAGYQGRRNMGNGGVAFYALDPNARWSDDRFNADITYHNPKLTEHWDMTAQVSYLDINTSYHNQTVFPPGHANFPNGFLTDAGWASRQTHSEFSGFYSGFNKHLLRIGVGYQYVDLYKLEQVNFIGGIPLLDLSDSEASFGRELIRSNWHTFIQDSWRFLLDWELTAGVRYDEYSDFGNTTNPRLALVWQTRPSFTTKLLYGQAFRAPTFNQINDSESNPLALGNPNLKPETIETWELAFDYRAADNLHFGLNLFTYYIEDKVVFVSEFGSDEVMRAQNVGEQEGQGFEFETRWQATKKFKLLFNYAFQNSTDKTNDHTVGNAPQHQVYLRTDWLLVPDWFLNAQANWVGERERPFGDPRDNVEDYTTVDLTLRHPQKSWEAAISVRNLFDEDVREPSSIGPDSSGIITMPHDLPMAGRSFFGELRYNF